MHLHFALLLVACLLGASVAQVCPRSGYVVVPASNGIAAHCCPPLESAYVYNMACSSLTVQSGMIGRRCDRVGVYTSDIDLGIIQFYSLGGAVNGFVSGQAAAGGGSTTGAVGGLGSRASAQFQVPERAPGSRLYFSLAARRPRPAYRPDSTADPTRGSGSGAYISITAETPNGSPYQSQQRTLVIAGGGGAGEGASSALSDGKPATSTFAGDCYTWSTGDGPYDDSKGGAGGGGCVVNGALAQPGSTRIAGGQGGTSGVYSYTSDVSYSPLSFSPPTVAAATSRVSEQSVFFQCFLAPETTTTVTSFLPSSTLTSTQTRFVSTEVTTPAISITTTTLQLESAQPRSTVRTTETPAVSSFTEIVDSTTTPPLSFVTSTFTPEVSLFTETTTETISPATRTVSSTYTPPTSFFAETVSKTATPALVVVPVTSTPATSTIKETVQVTTTPSTSTKTAVSTSSTGASNCVQFRLVFPAACCPNTYLDMLKAPRLRRDLAPRALTTTQVTSGIASTVVTVDGTTTTTAATPLSTSVSTEYFPGPITTVTETETAPAPSETTTTIRYAEAAAPTSTLVSTLVASSSTQTITETVTLETPIYTDVSTAPAPSFTSTETLSFTAETPTSTQTFFAATPLLTSKTTVYEQAATPVTTTSTTAYARSTSCKVQLEFEQKKCAAGTLKVAERITTIALIKTKKLFGGKPVIIDCGDAGVFTY